MADTEYPSNEFELRLTNPKHNEQVASEMHNGGILAFKVYPKAWDNDRHGSTERYDVSSPQHDDDDDDDDYGEDHMISKRDGLRRNLPTMMSPTTLSPPARYVASQVSKPIIFIMLFYCSVAKVTYMNSHE